MTWQISLSSMIQSLEMYRKWSNERPFSYKYPSLKSAPPKSKIFEMSALSNKRPPLKIHNITLVVHFMY